MSSQISTLHVRVDEDTKDRAAVALGDMGLSVAEAVRLFLRLAADDEAFRLDLKVPNAVAERDR